jgi:hypothetical protein
MPVVQSTAYATVESVTQLARALVNDMLISQAGEILTDTAPFTFPLLNSAARYCGRKLANNGVKTFTIETVLTPITQCSFPNLGLGGADPGQQVYVSDAGYFNGSTFAYPPNLPSSLRVPLDLWERATGSLEQWLLMKEYPDGIPSTPQSYRLCFWEWRNEQIWMPGATQINDLKLRFESDIMMFATVNDTILIRDSTDAIANYLAALFTNARNPMAAASFSAAGDDFTNQIILSNVHAAQRETYTRIPWNGRGRGRV